MSRQREFSDTNAAGARYKSPKKKSSTKAKPSAKARTAKQRAEQPASMVDRARRDHKRGRV